jgi:hypothetical protein
MNIHEMVTNLNTVEISWRMRDMVFNDITILSECFSNILKRETLNILNTTTGNTIPVTNILIENISKKENYDQVSQTIDNDTGKIISLHLRILYKWLGA